MVAAVGSAAPTVATSVTPAEPAVAVLAPPSIPVTPVPAPDYVNDMVTAGMKTVGPGMTLGTAVLDLTTGELATGGTGQFYSASLSKVMLAVDILDSDVDLSTSDEQWIARALGVSDDNAMNALWSKFDGADAITRVATKLGMADTGTPEDPGQWGETLVSPAGFARLYQYILTEMDPDDRDLIVSDLSAAEPTAADGYNQSFGLLGQSAQVYAKQGWMFYGNKLYLHSAGVVHNSGHDYVVVLMSVQPPSSTVAQNNLTATATAMLAALSENS
jgi:Beta-lactamase enzyme family